MKPCLKHLRMFLVCQTIPIRPVRTETLLVFFPLCELFEGKNSVVWQLAEKRIRTSFFARSAFAFLSSSGVIDVEYRRVG